MKADNPLTSEFLTSFPAESARVIEEISPSHAAALFAELSLQTGAQLMASMLPVKAVACIDVMPVSMAAKLLTALPTSSSARIVRLLPLTKRSEISDLISSKTLGMISSYLKYPAASAGTLLNPEVVMLPENVTVADAIRRIERLHYPASCEVYIVDDAQHLTGMITLGKLMTSIHHSRLRDIMSRKVYSVSARATAESLLSHPGWLTWQKLPVVDHSNKLVGVLDYKKLRASVGEYETESQRDPMDSLLSLVGLYWLSLAQLLDSVLGIGKFDKGERK